MNSAEFTLQQNKKAQEEMVGFIMIMVLVAIIFVVFLGFSLKSGSIDKADNEEISQFLDSVMEYTTSCSLSAGYSPLKLETLIKECAQDSGKTCETGENVCSLAKQVLIEAIEASWQFSPESPETGYQMNVKLSDSENSLFF